MPVSIPNLDDRNYDQFYSEAMGVITRYYPEYADIGPSDPAMALTELFCYYFDVTSYQIDQVTPEAWRNFAALLGIQNDGERPEESIRKALAELSSLKRAVTADDIEAIVKRDSNAARACVLQGERLLVNVVAREGYPSNETELFSIYRLLRGCSPLGTRYKIQYAPVLKFDVSAEIVKYRSSTIADNTLTGQIKERLSAFFSKYSGGDEGVGWEFGRAVSRSEIYGIIEGIYGVDHVSSLSIMNTGGADRGDDELWPDPGGLVELVKASVTVRRMQ